MHVVWEKLSSLNHICLSSQQDGPILVSRLLGQMMKSDKYGERRGAAFGLAGVVKGFGISCLKKYGIVSALHEGLTDRCSLYFLSISAAINLLPNVVAQSATMHCSIVFSVAFIFEKTWHVNYFSW